LRDLLRRGHFSDQVVEHHVASKYFVENFGRSRLASYDVVLEIAGNNGRFISGGFAGVSGVALFCQ
jgi:hypothetical protein